MKKLCDLYINRAGLVGVFYCALPSLGWFVSMLLFVHFREVYLVRLAWCLAVGCPIGAYLNRYSVDIWLIKHYRVGSQVGGQVKKGGSKLE
jgi:hypothetical protein